MSREERANLEEIKTALDRDDMVRFLEKHELNYNEKDTDAKLAERIHRSEKFNLDLLNNETLKYVIDKLYHGEYKSRATKADLIDLILEKRKPDTETTPHPRRTYGRALSPSSPRRTTTTTTTTNNANRKAKSRSPSPSRGQKRKTTEATTPMTPQDHLRNEFRCLSDQQLRNICEQKKLSKSGTKIDLIDRLIDDGFPITEYEVPEMIQVITECYDADPVSEDNEAKLLQQIRELRKEKSTPSAQAQKPKGAAKKQKGVVEDELGEEITIDRIKNFSEKVIIDALRHEWNVKVSKGADVYKLVMKKFENGDFTWAYFTKCLLKYM